MDLITTLKQLISFPTVTGAEREAATALAWVKKQLSSTPLIVKEFKREGYRSLVATTRRTKSPKVLLMAHLDVVPAPPGLFTPKMKGNRLYGRGVFDMKFAIACYLQLFRELGQKLRDYDVGMMLTTDEEIGGYHGAGCLVGKNGWSAGVCFLPDGGFNWNLEKGAKGIMYLDVRAEGKRAHASRPWTGKNAILSLAGFIDDLQKKFRAEKCCSDGDHYHDTMTVCTIVGGEAKNSVPFSAEAGIDIRLALRSSRASIQKKIRVVKDKHPDISVKESRYVHPYKNDIESSGIKRFRNIAKEMYGIDMTPSVSHGGSDAVFFRKKGVPVLLTTPKGGGHHTDAEWIDIKDLERFYQVMKQWVMEVGES